MNVAQRVQRVDQPTPNWLIPISEMGSDGTTAIVSLLVAVLIAGPFGYWIGHGAILGYWTMLTLLLLYRLWQQFRGDWLRWSLGQLRPVLAVLLVALASILWSLDPAWSAYQALWMLETTLLGLFVGYRFGPKEVMTVVFWLFSIILVASALCALLLPEYGLEEVGSEVMWVGIMPSRAGLGFMAGAAATFFLIGGLYRRLHPALAWPLLALAAFVLFMTKSATGLIVAAAALSLIILFWIGKLLRASALLAILLMVMAPLVVVTVIVNFDTVTGLVGRDPTLTNRTQIWADAVEVIKEAPLVGFGLNAVWGHRAETWFPHLPTTGWAAHAHNGYLMLATDLGVPVALLATIHLLRVFFMSLDNYISTRSSVALFALVYLFSFLLANLSEPRLYQARRLEWILGVVIMVNLLRELAPAKHPEASRLRSTSK